MRYGESYSMCQAEATSKAFCKSTIILCVTRFVKPQFHTPKTTAPSIKRKTHTQSQTNYPNTIIMTSPRHPTPEAVYVQPSSPRFPPSGTPTAGAQRKIGIAVDLSDESAFAVSWAVQNYLRPGDAVILLHVQPTSVLYGADWGAIDMTVREEIEINEGEIGNEETQQKKLEEDFDLFTNSKANDIAQPLVEAHIPFKIHIVKDHDMKERLCLEVERLGLSTLIMGSRGFGAAKRNAKGRLGSVSDYCVHHCVCPVVVVRIADEKDGGGGGNSGDFTSNVLEEEVEERGYYEALNKISGSGSQDKKMAGSS